MVGISAYWRLTRLGQARGSYSSQLSQRAAGGKRWRPSAGAWRSRATGWSGSVTRSVMVAASAERDDLTRADPEVLVEPEPGEGEDGAGRPCLGRTRDEKRGGQCDPARDNPGPEPRRQRPPREVVGGARGIARGMRAQELGGENDRERGEGAQEHQAQP